MFIKSSSLFTFPALKVVDCPEQMVVLLADIVGATGIRRHLTVLEVVLLVQYN